MVTSTVVSASTRVTTRTPLPPNARKTAALATHVVPRRYVSTAVQTTVIADVTIGVVSGVQSGHDSGTRHRRCNLNVLLRRVQSCHENIELISVDRLLWCFCRKKLCFSHHGHCHDENVVIMEPAWQHHQASVVTPVQPSNFQPPPAYGSDYGTVVAVRGDSSGTCFEPTV